MDATSPSHAGPPPATIPLFAVTLSPDEFLVLETFRALGIPPREAVRRLHREPDVPARESCDDEGCAATLVIVRPA